MFRHFGFDVNCIHGCNLHLFDKSARRRTMVSKFKGVQRLDDYFTKHSIRFDPYAASDQFGQYKMMKKPVK